MSDLSGYLAAIDREMRAALQSADTSLAPFYAMLQYHLGWADEQFRPVQAESGKRLRPIFCLLVCELLSGDSQAALPAAAAIELLHNFSLVHDDIEDSDRVRRHRATLWTLVEVPHAINAGDALFALAQRELLSLSERAVPAEQVLAASRLFQDTCVHLVEGQYLDMRAELFDSDVALGQSLLAYYKQMVAGKTAALLGAATGIGALVAGADGQVVKRCREYGVELGMAFQMTDDILGLWGQPAVTGKAAGADLRRKKKSLPIVLALQHGGPAGTALREVFARSVVSDDDVASLMPLLEGDGIRAEAEVEAEKHRHRAARNLARIVAGGVLSTRAAQTLEELTAELTHRAK